MPKVKLTDDDILEIRRGSQQGTPGVRLAAKYGVTRSHISNLVNGRFRPCGPWPNDVQPKAAGSRCADRTARQAERVEAYTEKQMDKAMEIQRERAIAQAEKLAAAERAEPQMSTRLQALHERRTNAELEALLNERLAERRKIREFASF